MLVGATLPLLMIGNLGLVSRGWGAGDGQQILLRSNAVLGEDMSGYIKHGLVDFSIAYRRALSPISAFLSPSCSE